MRGTCIAERVGRVQTRDGSDRFPFQDSFTHHAYACETFRALRVARGHSFQRFSVTKDMVALTPMFRRGGGGFVGCSKPRRLQSARIAVRTAGQESLAKLPGSAGEQGRTRWKCETCAHTSHSASSSFMSAIAVDCWRIPLGIVESGRTSCVARRGRAPARCSTFIIIFYEASNKLAVGEKGWRLGGYAPAK